MEVRELTLEEGLKVKNLDQEAEYLSFLKVDSFH
jgi:hypothetical protein